MSGISAQYCDGLEQRIAELEQENERLSRAWMNLQRRASADKVVELEQQLAELREAADMAILRHRVRKEDGVLVRFDMPSEEMERLAALLKQK